MRGLDWDFILSLFSHLSDLLSYQTGSALERHLKTTHVRDFAKLIADKGSIEHFRRYKKII